MIVRLITERSKKISICSMQQNNAYWNLLTLGCISTFTREPSCNMLDKKLTGGPLRKDRQKSCQRPSAHSIEKDLTRLHWMRTGQDALQRVQWLLAGQRASFSPLSLLFTTLLSPKTDIYKLDSIRMIRLS
jgi:hypothetical protein